MTKHPFTAFHTITHYGNCAVNLTAQGGAKSGWVQAMQLPRAENGATVAPFFFRKRLRLFQSSPARGGRVQLHQRALTL
jgi:hypothetical protein